MELEEIKNNLPKEIEIFDVADLFKVLGDSTRVKILYVLENRELCVNDICKCVCMEKSAVSHQLRVLRQSKLVKSRKDGKEVYYSFDDDHVKMIFQYGREHTKEKKH